MIRIKPNKCGYSIYQCTGLPDLSATGYLFNADTVVRELTGGTVSISDLDSEFNQLPVKIKGMVFTTDTMDMSWPDGGPHPEVPELSCRSDTDPTTDTSSVSVWGTSGIPVDIDSGTYNYPVYGGTTGWVDLFNSHYVVSGSTTYFYRDKVFIVANGSTVTGIATNIPVFHPSDSAEYEFNPGLLEPILDTDFDPIQIDTIPAWEAGDDSFIFEAIVMNTWKDVIDDRINNIYGHITNIHPSGDDIRLRNLKGDEYKDSECVNFQIILTGGTALRTGDDRETESYATDQGWEVGDVVSGRTLLYAWVETSGDKPYKYVFETGPNVYKITAGTISIGKYNGCVVSEVTDVYAPFYAYLSVAPKNTKEFTEQSALPQVPDPEHEGQMKDAENGDILDDGSVISGIENEGTTQDPSWSWTQTYEYEVGASGTITVVPGIELSARESYDPPAGSYGIGGVRIAKSDNSSTAYILYKIYHEDCISSVELSGGNNGTAFPGWIGFSITAPYPEILNDIEIVGETVTVDPETQQEITGTTTTVLTAKPGTVQPVASIQLHSTAGEMTRIESPLDVPTVEAVYNFVKGQTTYTYGEFAAASSLATVIIMGSTSTEVPVEEGSTETVTVYGVTTGDAEQGTYFVTGNIVVIGNDGVKVNPTALSGGTTADGFVPTAQGVVDYVYTFVSNYKASAGHIEVSGTPSAASISGGSYGIVLTSDNIDTGTINTAIAQVVPTVLAVATYVNERIPADIVAGGMMVTGSGTSTEEELAQLSNTKPEPRKGPVYVARNIELAPVEYRSESTTDVPTIEAVYNFIHGSTVYNDGESTIPLNTARALATAGPITVGSTSVGGDITSYIAGTMGVVYVATGINYPADYVIAVNDCVPSVSAVISYVSAVMEGSTAFPGYVQASGSNPYEEVNGATTGLIRYVKNIDFSPANHTDASATESVVPSVAAVYKFIHARASNVQYSTALAVSGSITDVTTGSAVTGITFTGGTPGTCEITSNIKEHPTSHESLTTCVPTADAVVKYVNGLGLGSSDSGKIEIGSVTVGTMVYSYGERWGQNADAAHRGTVEVSDRILIATDPNLQVLSHEAVPSVWAVYDFVHSTADASANPNGGSKQALATEGTITAPTSGTVATLNGATPGTCYTVSDMEDISGIDITVSETSVVPTVGAVKAYVAAHGGSGDPAVAGKIQVSGSGSSATDSLVAVATGGSTPTEGIVYLSRNINIAATAANRGGSPTSVPTVEAVYNFIHNKTDYNGAITTTTASAFAVGGTMSQSASTVVPTYAGTPGTVRLATDIKVKVTTNGKETVADASCVVPTAQAVVNYIDTYGPAASAVRGHLNAGGNNADYLGTGQDGTGPIQGIVWVSENVLVNGNRGDSKTAVPTVEAVYSFIHSKNYEGSESSALAVSDGDPGTVYVKSYIPDDPSSEDSKVPTIGAIREYISGGTSGGGGDLSYPNWNTLASDSGGLAFNQTYSVTTGGWLRVSNNSSSNCAAITLNGVVMGLGTGPHTWVIPLKTGTTFMVSGGAGTIQFDGSCSTSSSLSASYSKGNRGVSDSSTGSMNLMKLNGITKYDGISDAEEDDSDDILAEYIETSTQGSKADLEQITSLAYTAETTKNHVITCYETVLKRNKTAATMSYRCGLCADYIVSVCSTASTYYQQACEETDQATAMTYLNDGDHYKAIAQEWIATIQYYVSNIDNMLSDNSDIAKCLDDARGFVAQVEECYDNVVTEHDRLVVIGITGGTTCVAIADRFLGEAHDWYSRACEESEKAERVCTSAYNKASGYYADANDVYTELDKQAVAAHSYVNGLSKPQQR